MSARSVRGRVYNIRMHDFLDALAVVWLGLLSIPIGLFTVAFFVERDPAILQNILSGLLMASPSLAWLGYEKYWATGPSSEQSSRHRRIFIIVLTPLIVYGLLMLFFVTYRP